MMRQRQRVKHGAAGMTLVELLVTLGIVTLIAALVLPAVRSLMTSRKASQAGLLVRNYLEAARARAIASGKEVAVVLERVSSRVYDANGDGIIDLSEIRSAIASDTDLASNYTVYNACIRLSLAEEQRPSDAQSFGIERLVQSTPTPINAIEYGGVVGNYNTILLRGNVLTTPIIRSLFQTQPYNDTRVLDVPMQISFGGIKYPIVKVVEDTNDFAPGIRQFAIFVPQSRSIETNELVNPPDDLPKMRLYPFNIHFRPRFSATQSLSMPRGTCVDLSLSGFGTQRSINVLNAAGVATSNALGDYRLRFSSDWVSPITGPVPGSLRPLPTATELRPVILVFGGNGALQRVYTNYDMPTNAGLIVNSYKAIDVVDDVYLHIGKIDQVTVKFEPSEFPYAGNLADSNSQIIRISGSDGSISVSQAGTIRLPDDTLPTLDSVGNPVPPELDPSWIGSPLTRVSNLGPLVELVRRRAIGSTQTTQ
ncbi:pilus assembly FimT family protein [Pirellulaceae bacterium SH449]